MWSSRGLSSETTRRRRTLRRESHHLHERYRIEFVSTTGRLLRIVRSSRGWLATGPKFKLHPRIESLMRVGARSCHHAGANFSQVLCLADGKLECASARIWGGAFPDTCKSPRRNFNCIAIYGVDRISVHTRRAARIRDWLKRATSFGSKTKVLF